MSSFYVLACKYLIHSCVGSLWNLSRAGVLRDKHWSCLVLSCFPSSLCFLLCQDAPMEFSHRFFCCDTIPAMTNHFPSNCKCNKSFHLSLQVPSYQDLLIETRNVAKMMPFKMKAFNSSLPQERAYQLIVQC